MKSLVRSIAALMILSFPCLATNAVSKLPLTLTITVSPPATVGDDILFPSVLKNVSTHVINVGAAGTMGRFAVLIHDEHGKVPPLKPGTWSFGSSAVLWSIEPGKTWLQYIGLNRYDLAPGKYIVKVECFWPGGAYPKGIMEYPKGVMIESNEITITVLPKKAGETK